MTVECHAPYDDTFSPTSGNINFIHLHQEHDMTVEPLLFKGPRPPRHQDDLALDLQPIPAYMRERRRSCVEVTSRTNVLTGLGDLYEAAANLAVLKQVILPLSQLLHFSRTC
jgi:hypothetical protein